MHVKEVLLKNKEHVRVTLINLDLHVWSFSRRRLVWITKFKGSPQDNDRTKGPIKMHNNYFMHFDKTIIVMQLFSASIFLMMLAWSSLKN